MDINEMVDIFDSIGVPRRYYSLKSGLDENFYLVKTGNNWEYYFLERGKKTERKFFYSEGEACAFFLKFIINRKYEWIKYK